MSNTNIDEKLLEGLSQEERDAVLTMMKEFSSCGQSKTYEELLYADYKEIPVDIETFLTDDTYLGKAWKDVNGNSKIYPFWMKTLKDIFPDNITTNFDTLLESGARGIGKSEVACGAICAYLMYRVMCLKNPLEYYHIKLTEKIAFAFMNIKLDLAEAIATDKFQKTIQMSSWFMSKGTMTQRNNKPYWNPPDPIEIIIGSQSDDLIGRPIFFCLDGDTIINTINGDFKISDLENKLIKVNNVDNGGNLCVSDECTVKMTGEYIEEYEIELEDGSIIKCTPNHKFMLKDGTYKEAKDLTEEDELFDFSITYDEFIQNIIKTRGQWNIPNNEYWEGHHILPQCLGGTGKTNQKHPNIIRLYAHEHFIAHKLLANEHPNNKQLVYAWCMMAYPKGKTKRDFEITPKEYEELRILQSNVQKGSHLSEETKQKLRDANIGKKASIETKAKISAAHKDKIISNETKLKMSIAQKNLDRKDRKPTLLNKRCITDGKSIKYIDKNEPIPENWYLGNCKTACRHNMMRYYSNESLQAKRRLLSSGKNNNMFGHGEKLSGGKNGHAIYIYTYKDVDYDCRDDLMIELKKEFADISESSIRKIMSGKYTKRISKKYQSVIDNLTWRLKKDENQKH